MDGARDAVMISFPFAAGVALAHFCPFSLFHFCIALVAALLLAILAGRLSGKICYNLLFLVLGALSYATRGDAAHTPGTDAGVPARALSYTVNLINSIPFPHDSTNELLRALLTGQRNGLSLETVQAFRSAGASHILALSGLHLGIIYLFLGKTLSIFGNSRTASVIRSMVIVAACAFYAFMTGASPSIVRALLFISMNEALRHAPGRQKNPVSVWCAALLIQLAACPWIISSAGFQLSYMAMLGIFVLFPRLDAFYPRSGKRWSVMRWMWSSMALSVSCQVFTAPLAWIHFRSFPRHFLLTNLLALPLTLALMFCAVSLLLLSLAGLSPAWLIRLTDFLATILQDSLRIIAALN